MAWRKVYLATLAVLLAALTVLLSAAAVRIWQEGSARKAENPLESVYTLENVEKELLRVAPLFAAVVVMTAAGLLLGVRDEKSTRPVPAPEAERDLLASRLGDPGEEILKERKKQQAFRWGSRALFAGCMVPVALYCLDRGHFPESDLEGMAASLALHTAPFVAAGMLVLLLGALLEEKSIRREIEAARSRLREGKNSLPAAGGAGRKPDRWIPAVRTVLLVAAAVFIVLGILNGSLNDVLLKAINICTECIGLG